MLVSRGKKKKKKSSTVGLSLSQNVSPNAFIQLVNKHFLRSQCVQHCTRGSGEGKVVESKMQKK